MRHKIRVVQYGVGPIGAGIVRLLLEKPEIEIVGAVDIDSEKVGRDLGEIVGANRTLGIPISDDPTNVLRAGAHVVVHSTSSYLTQVADQLICCLRAQAHVISTCEELAYPFRKHPELSSKLDRVAREHHVALLGTGVNPGFAMDKLALTLASACQRVNKIRVRRVVDTARRRLPLQKKVGTGLTVEEFEAQVRAGTIKHHGLPESAAMIADSLGLEVARLEETILPVVAEAPVRSEYFDVPSGKVKGVRQVALGLGHDGEERVRLELAMVLGALDPVDAVDISGVPDLALAVAGGIHGDLATAAVAVNCVPAMLETRPGLRTSRDIPMCYVPGVPLRQMQPA